VNRDSGRPVPVDPHTLTVAKAAQDYADLTGGALDATILPLMRYWGFMERLDSIPRERNLGPHLERVRYRQVLIRDGQLGLLQMGGELDFGGTAKGYAVDRAVGRLRDAGIAGGLVEAGGDLYAAGRPEAHRRWNIGIRDPLRPDGLFATVEVENEAVATSGGYEQFHLIGGRPVSHLIDPRTGQPVEEIISATVFAPTTMEADALATATSVPGVEAALDLLRQRPAVEGVWVTADGMRWTTPELTGRIRWV
jgi:thiamine biosynthesis lipoprotein